MLIQVSYLTGSPEPGKDSGSHDSPPPDRWVAAAGSEGVKRFWLPPSVCGSSPLPWRLQQGLVGEECLLCGARREGGPGEEGAVERARRPYSPLPQVEQSSQGSSNFDPNALPHEPSSLRPRLAFEASELGLQEGSGHPRLVGTAQLWGHSRGWGLVGFLGSGL